MTSARQASGSDCAGNGDPPERSRWQLRRAPAWPLAWPSDGDQLPDSAGQVGWDPTAGEIMQLGPSRTTRIAHGAGLPPIRAKKAPGISQDPRSWSGLLPPPEPRPNGPLPDAGYLARTLPPPLPPPRLLYRVRPTQTRPMPACAASPTCRTMSRHNRDHQWLPCANRE